VLTLHIKPLMLETRWLSQHHISNWLLNFAV